MSSEAVKEAFDNAAQNWDNHSPRMQMVNEISDKILATIPMDKSMKALEYGCGTGNVAVKFSQRVGKITAIDLSEGMLEQLRNKIKREGIANVKPLQRDLSLENSADDLDGSYDLIYSMMTMHHVRNVDRLLENLIDLLKDGGTLVLIDLEKEDGTFHEDDVPVEHLGFEPETLREKLVEKRMTDIQFSTVYTMTRFNDDDTKRGDYPIFMLSARRYRPQSFAQV